MISLLTISDGVLLVNRKHTLKAVCLRRMNVTSIVVVIHIVQSDAKANCSTNACAYKAKPSPLKRARSCCFCHRKACGVPRSSPSNCGIHGINLWASPSN